MIQSSSGQNLEEFFRDHSTYVFNLAFFLTKRHDLAEDITQEVFVKFFEKNIVLWDQDPRPFLRRITYNQTFDILKSQKTRQRHEFAKHQSTQLEISFDDNEDQKIVLEVLNNLDDKFRIPLAMRFLGGSKFKEIASELNIPLATVQGRIEKGMDLMRSQLKQKGFGALVPLLEDLLLFEDVSINWPDTFVDQIEQKISSAKVTELAVAKAGLKIAFSMKVIAMLVAILSLVGILNFVIDDDSKWNRPLDFLAQVINSDATNSFKQWIGQKLSFEQSLDEKDFDRLDRYTKSLSENHDNKTHPNRSKDWEGSNKGLSASSPNQDFQPLDDSLTSSNKKSVLKNSKGKAFDPTQFLFDENGDLIVNLDPQISEAQSVEENFNFEPQNNEEVEESGDENPSEQDDSGEGEGSEDDEVEDDQEEEQDDQESTGDPGDNDELNGEESYEDLPENLRCTYSSSATNLVDNASPRYHIYLTDKFLQPQLISQSSSGVAANFNCLEPSLSSNGRYVAFSSRSTNLIETTFIDNTIYNVYIKDLSSGILELVSVGASGQPGSGSSSRPGLSADGRFVVFYSAASNFSDKDIDVDWDIYVRDRLLKTTRLVNLEDGPDGAKLNQAMHPSISASGQFVAFVALDSSGQKMIFVRDLINQTTQMIDADPVVSSFPFGVDYPSLSADGRYISFCVFTKSPLGSIFLEYHIYVRDRQENQTYLISKNTQGNPQPITSQINFVPPAISGDGQSVIFHANDSNFVEGDTNGQFDIFVAQVPSGDVERVSLSLDGGEPNGTILDPKMTSDARFVAFSSNATNLTTEEVSNHLYHIYVRDRQTQKTYLMSKKGGILSNGFSFTPSVSN